MGKIGEDGISVVRVIGSIVGIQGNEWHVKSVANGGVWRFDVISLATLLGALDPRLGDQGQLVDVEGVLKTSGVYHVRQVSIIDEEVDVNVIKDISSL